ncbi:GGDEF domain-containing protein [Arsenicitalea aurantiaca]|uniref:diguanylate cyclase n=1 Tax=Arsenicitalea aurantiaca TaxID=1783274 RepID=A0A433XKR9_9HYPH|nr:GGDEF domain-containing protein [Arsenicitalea aurantiaca]RUT34653.1 GGDEF domain-containing protein [Arsenicitalea aurantiaca]
MKAERTGFFGRIDFSARGHGRVVLWTVGGTIGCILAALYLDSFNFVLLDEEARNRAIVFDIVVPLLIAGPLFYFFSSRMRDLAIAHHQMEIYASTDSLTSVLNRGAFTTLVDAYLEDVRNEESRARGALLVVDADNFKVINDNYGHDCGDEALKLIAQSIKGTLRGADIVGRIGGEEFGIFLPGSSALNAEAVAERIRQSVNTTEFEPHGTALRLSVSVGGAIFDRPISFQDLFREADRRLYEAKQKGRNRIAVSPILNAA